MLQTWSKSVVVSRFDPQTSHSQNDALKEDLLALPTNRLWSPGQQGCLANACFMVTMFLKFVSTFTHWCWYRIGPAKKKLQKAPRPVWLPLRGSPGHLQLSLPESRTSLELSQSCFRDEPTEKISRWLKWLCHDSPESADCSYVFRNRTPMLWLSSVSDNSPPSSHPLNSKTCAWWQTLPNIKHSIQWE